MPYPRSSHPTLRSAVTELDTRIVIVFEVVFVVYQSRRVLRSAFGVNRTNEVLVTSRPGVTVIEVFVAAIVATPDALSTFTRPLVRRA
jgi:hypothetical protein